MTKRSPADLGWLDVRNAAWWLGLLYRRPHRLQLTLEGQPKSTVLRFGAVLLFHALVYTVVIAAICRAFLFGSINHLWQEGVSAIDGGVLQSILDQSAAGIILGGAGGIAILIVRTLTSGFSKGFARGVTEGISVFMAVGIILGIYNEPPERIDEGIAFGTIVGLVIGIVFGISSGIREGIAVGVTSRIALLNAGTIGISVVLAIALWITAETAFAVSERTAAAIAGGFALWIAFGLAMLRVYYYPWHVLLFIIAPTAASYRLHPAAWDDLCSVPFVGFDQLLLTYQQANPSLGNDEIERLIKSCPSQRFQALKALSAVIAREAAGTDLDRLDARILNLPAGDKGFFKQSSIIRKMVIEIAEAKRRLDTIDRPFLRAPYGEALVSKISGFRGQVSGFREPLASEFRKAADVWLNKAQAELEQIQRVTEKEPTPQVFRAGDPVDRTQEAFVPRMAVIGQLERQLTLATGCPGLLVYGRRRMGKSTLIRNLDAFVPPNVKLVSISLQNPTAIASLGHFSRLVDQELSKTLEDQMTLRSDDLDGLYRRLSHANEFLKSNDSRLAVALDEFENIDRKIGEGVFPLDLLSTFRESIQNHRRLIWAFVGSHHITELIYAEWPSYLVSAQTIEIPPFSLAETLLLLTDPLKESPLYKDDARRPRFDPGFWGEGGIKWIHDQTAGWPHLVQLLASTAVDLANESVADRLDQKMLEEAGKRSLVLGDTVLRQLINGETKSSQEAMYIARFRREKTQPAPENDAVLTLLRHRQIITEEAGAWRLKVPLMQQWLESRS